MGLRPIRTQTFQVALRSDYLNPTAVLEFEERKDFFTLLKFLNYCKDLNYQSDSLGLTHYRKISFRLRDFVRYETGKLKPRHDEVEKAILFFQNL